MDKNDIVVHCTTLEQKKCVVKYVDDNVRKTGFNVVDDWNEDIVLTGSDAGCHSTTKYSESKGVKIISYQDFEKDYLKITPKYTNYVKCIQCLTTEWKPNKIYKLENNRIRTENGYLPNDNYRPGQSYYNQKFEPSTEQEYNIQEGIKPKEDEVMKLQQSDIGRYVKALVADPWGSNVPKDSYGKIISVPKDSSNNFYVHFPTFKHYACSMTAYAGKLEIMPIGWTPESEKKKDNREELFEEAKKRYPVGTKFRIAHRQEQICTVKSHDRHNKTFVDVDGFHINFLINEIDDILSASVYAMGTWAPIVEEPKFVVGKWYLYKHARTDFYLKCTKDSNDTIRYSEYIETGGKLTCAPGEYKLGENSYVTDQEVSIDKLQQYLPDGHVDKIKKEPVMENTQYWVVTYSGANSYINKLKVSNNTGLGDCIGYINLQHNFYTKGGNGSGFIEKRPATQEEIDWIDACIKANKFIPLEEVNKKVSAEYVKINNRGCNIGGYSSSKLGLENSKIYRILPNNPQSKYDEKFVIELSDGYVEIGQNKGQNYFEISTKEAFDAQNAPKTEKVMDNEYKPWVVQYSPEWTEDLFNAAIKWCEDVRKKYPRQPVFKAATEDYTLNGLKTCIRAGGYLCFWGPDKAGNMYLYGINNNVDRLKDNVISVSQLKTIIGYSSPEMKKDDLLEEAKRRYPLGTTFQCVSNDYGKREVTVTSDGYWEKGDISGPYVIFRDKTDTGYYAYLKYKSSEWATIVSKPKDDLQEEAKRMYPVGTEYICPYNKKKFIISEIDSTTYKIYGDNNIDAGHGRGYLYYSGKWAEIVSKPLEVRGEPVNMTAKVTIKPNFKVGDTVRCIGTSPAGTGDKDITNGGSGWKLGKEFKIIDISDWSDRKILWPEGGGSGVFDSHVELVEYERFVIGHDPIDFKEIRPKNNVEPKLQIDAEVTNVKVKPTVPVTLKNADYEVKVKVNQTNSVKIKI